MADIDDLVAKLEEGVKLTDSEVRVLRDWNEPDLMEKLFGSTISSDNLISRLSPKAVETLNESVGDDIGLRVELGLQDVLMGFGPTGSAKVLGGSIGGKEVAPHVIGAAGSGLSGIGRSVFSWMRAHKVKTGIGIAGLGAWGLGGDLFGGGEEGATGAPDQSLGGGTQDRGLIVLDPSTGQAVPLSEIDPSFTNNQQVQSSFGQVQPGSDLFAYAISLGIDPSTLGLGFGGAGGINSLLFGTEKVNPSEYPSGVDVYGNPIQSPQDFIGKRTPTNPETERKLTGMLPGEDLGDRAAGKVAAPPGAELNPRFFSTLSVEPDTTATVQAPEGAEAGWFPDRSGQRSATVKGRTSSLSTTAAAAAAKYGVPIDVLYGVINATSGWDKSAVGNQGTSFGLAQIPDGIIDRNRAQNPQFSLDWAAQTLSRYYQGYGSWELAALNFRNPGAAGKLVQTGKISSDDKLWLGDALESAAKSGLGSNMFDFAGLAALQTDGGGSGRSGPTIPSFVPPDRASLREVARSAVKSIYGRSTDGDELEAFVEELMAGYQESYNQQVSALKGGPSVDVDPQARLVDTLRTSGEGEFRVERDQQRSVMDQFAGWAQVLREV